MTDNSARRFLRKYGLTIFLVVLGITLFLMFSGYLTD
jgi:hypothetical protein